MPKDYKVVITDTSCLIILRKIDAIELLNELFSVVITTPEIASEYGLPLPKWMVIKPVRNITLQEEFHRNLDAGEASAIALASEIRCDFLVLDDLDARKFAEKLCLKVIGSVGLLLTAKQKGVITLLKPYLDKIQQTNFRISSSLIQSILTAAGES
jgi:predicted nucleic acid-binding protein